MKILLLSDIHNDIYSLEKISKKHMNEIKKTDLVICNGDFIDMFKIESSSWLDVFETVLNSLLSLDKPMLCVPGNHDPEVCTLLLEKKQVNLHNKLKTVSGFDFIGYGGAGSPLGTTNFEPSADEVKKNMTLLLSKSKNPKVFVNHDPVFGTGLDVVFTGEHVGSLTMRELVEKYKPALVLSAHIHESAGIDRMGDSVLFYPGAVFENKFGFVELNKNRPPKCVIKNI